MRTSDVSAFLAQTIQASLPVLLTGAPGVGKTDIVRQAAQEAGADLIVSHPVVADPTDAKGLPWPVADKSRATFLPFGELADAVAATVPTVWLLDDLGQAPAAVQAAYMQLILGRRVNGHYLPDCVTFLACTNRREDRAGVQGILEPVKSRFAAIVSVEPHIDDWGAWALSSGFVVPELVAFLRNRPDLLHAPAPTAEMTNAPSPRTWANLARLQGLSLPDAIRMQAFMGAVGEGAAVEYLAFLRMYASLVSVDQILVDPRGAPIPEKPAELYAVATACGFRANAQTFGRIGQYCERMADAGRGEFAVLTVRDAIRRESGLVNTPEYVRMASGPLGKLIMGEVN